jgi:serine/threonine protein kinase
MPVAAGTRIGVFEILAPLGAGGMGEVYRAKDTKLDREVAIKVLPEAVARDAERLARFEREAKMLAALNHPNIAHIYGVEDGALVMELVEGDEPKGPLEWDEAWKIASQVADALEYAHERGIIHRDLKPPNIKVTPEGTVKLLDFGLAKAIEDRAANVADPANSPTFTMGATTAGMILGTAAYMAPEQAKGKAVDRRCDIWSFGAVLFELLSGKRAFAGESVTETLAMVLKVEPDWNALPARTPAAARKLLDYCLKKERSERLQAIGDARLLLAVEPAAPAPKVRTLWPWAAVAIVMTIAAAWGWLRPRPAAPPAQSLTLTIVPPKGTDLPPLGSQAAVPLLSPDGSYVLAGNLLRSMKSIQVEPLRGMAGLSGEPFWSVDSKTVTYPVGGRELRKLRVPDGAPELAGQLPGINRGGAWTQDGTILMATSEAGVWALYMLRLSGSPTRVDVPGLKDGVYYRPEFLPDSSDFLFTFRPDGAEQAEIFLATLKDGKVISPVKLMQNPTAARYTPAGGGRLLFVRNDNLYSQRLNLKGRKMEGDAELVQQGVASAPGIALAYFSVSRAGLVAWRPGTQILSQVRAFDRQGRQVGTFGPPNDFNYLRLSPDETHLLAHSEDSGAQLLERDRPGMFNLGPVAGRLVWSPDGSNLFGRRDSQIVERSVSGSGEVRTLAEAPGINFLEDVAQDEKLALYSTNSNGERSIFSVRLDGSQGRRLNRLIQPGEQILNARFSPDGRWIVYTARTAQNESLGIFVQPFPGPGVRRQISSTGVYPVWREDGKEIIFADSVSGKISSIAVRGPVEELQFGSPTPLFEIPPSLAWWSAVILWRLREMARASSSP